MEGFLRATASYLRTKVRLPVSEVEAIRHIIGVAETLEMKANELKEMQNADQDKQKNGVQCEVDLAAHSGPEQAAADA